MDGDGEFLKDRAGNMLQGGLVGGFEDDWASGSSRVGFYPAGGADAPLVTGIEAWEAEFGAWGREIVAGSF